MLDFKKKGNIYLPYLSFSFLKRDLKGHISGVHEKSHTDTLNFCE